ncbi:unnamed protein product [Phaedon cochleariae]|uniref:Uncharacterized protein n=1 Tax=Phaedon cochleariae TaxID=80249 RepID=A0A9N9X1J1_PHACE|nr:unnamed protein product [Phaedon cochleariae]
MVYVSKPWTFSDTNRLAGSDSSSEESGASTSPPTTPPPAMPYQERARRSAQAHRTGAHAHHLQHQRHQLGEFGGKHQRPMGVAAAAAASLRVKPSQREMNFSFNPNNRPMYRCDGPQYPMTQAFYRNMNYNRTHKNVLRV